MSDRSRLRLFVFQLLVLSLFVALGSRLWFLQIMDSAKYVAKQESTTAQHSIVTAAARGRILDVQGRELATNVATYAVSVNIKEFPREFANPAKKRNPVRANVIRKLSGLLKMDESEIDARTTLCEYKDKKLVKGERGRCWNGSQYQPIPIMRDVPERPAFLIEEHAEDFPGVDASLEPVRTYPSGQLAAHLLGYVQPSTDDAGLLVGRTGLEMQYDAVLKGARGSRTVETNRAGVITREVKATDPVPGADLILSVDLNVQKVAEDALEKAIKRARTITDPCKDCATAGQLLKAPAGAAVVLEAKTGRVVAMASYPTYEPAKFLKGIVEGSDDHKYLFDKKLVPQVSRAYQGEYAPGSTFKHVSTTAAVTNGQGLNGTYDCPGTYKIGADEKSNYEGIGIPGAVSWRTILIESCDTVYYKIAEQEHAADEALIDEKRKPREQLQQWAARFGFGSKTEIDLPGEEAGAIPTREWVRKLSARLRPSNCKLAKETKDPQQAELFKDLCQNGSQYRPGDQANAAVGQGYVLATPLQLAVSYSALINGGNIMEPRVAKAIVAPGGSAVQEIKPVVKSKLDVDPAILNYIASSLAEVPKTGTAKCAFGMADASTDCKQTTFSAFPFDQLAIGGKTGTAEVYKKQDTSWFASFGPVNDPRYVVVAMIEEAGTGGTVAAPAARDIWSGIYGLEGKTPALANGELPAKLPTILRDGRIVPAGKRVVLVPAEPSTPAEPTSTPAAALRADLPGRRNGRL